MADFAQPQSSFTHRASGPHFDYHGHSAIPSLQTPPPPRPIPQPAVAAATTAAVAPALRTLGGFGTRDVRKKKTPVRKRRTFLEIGGRCVGRVRSLWPGPPPLALVRRARALEAEGRAGARTRPGGRRKRERPSVGGRKPVSARAAGTREAWGGGRGGRAHEAYSRSVAAAASLFREERREAYSASGPARRVGGGAGKAAVPAAPGKERGPRGERRAGLGRVV